MAPALTDRVLALIAAAIHGYCRASRQPPVPAMDTVIIAALAGRPRAKPSTPAAIVTVMEAGSSIRPASTGAPVLAETAALRIMIMPATA